MRKAIYCLIFLMLGQISAFSSKKCDGASLGKRKIPLWDAHEVQEEYQKLLPTFLAGSNRFSVYRMVDAVIFEKHALIWSAGDARDEKTGQFRGQDFLFLLDRWGEHPRMQLALLTADLTAMTAFSGYAFLATHTIEGPAPAPSLFMGRVFSSSQRPSIEEIYVYDYKEPEKNPQNYRRESQIYGLARKNPVAPIKKLRYEEGFLKVQRGDGTGFEILPAARFDFTREVP